MKNLRLAAFYLVAVILLMTTSCEENFMARDQHHIPIGKTLGDLNESPGGYTTHAGGWRYPYPEIIKKTFIPSYEKFDHTKCIAWRITWPEYQASADIEKIPTVFTTSNGALNSFYYLNNVDPQNTYNSKFNLYYDEKLASSSGLWNELNYTFNAPAGSMETVRFAKFELPVSSIQYWVEERPELFEINYPGVGDEEIQYQEGDFFIYFLTDQNLYGGVRIVSMSPRIIEVYYAVPNI
jgi:hypothetical protein